MSALAPPGVSVIVPHYGESAPALALVDALHGQVGAPPLQIVIVDDASPHRFPDTAAVTVIRRAENGGFGAAVNSGVAVAAHPQILVLNSDLDIEPSFVADFLRSAAPWQPAVCGPLLVGRDGVTQWAGRRWPRTPHHVVEWLTPLARFRPRLHEAVGHDTRCVAGAELRVDWVVGAALLMPTKAFRAVGGFDERYFMNVEEVDLQRRLTAAGVPSVFLGTVTVRHEGGGSSDSAYRMRWVTQARIQYAEKWGEHPGRLRFGLRAASAVNLVFNGGRRMLGRDVNPVAAYRSQLAAIRPATYRKAR
ncbi:glycosyltransferase family 2 protein [uncultured Microbacterium sp.]|uniref:glycosyltransferase family 2 protein n=1 Tax=uncultured Microbacterium sp. TaxID=191216 RepID=UPI00260C9942|nr:glycosyltransferase family 2 protein [uncultured Microbacterium sp.]